MKPFAYLILLACILNSCSSDTTDSEAQHVRPIRLSATINGVATRATASTGPIQDEEAAKAELTGIHFLRQDAAATPNGFSDATPIPASRDASGSITFDPAQNYNPNGNNTYFVAYWPAATTGNTSVGITAATSVTWTISGDVDILITGMYNAGSYTSPVTGSGLTFRHALAQLNVVLDVAPNTGQDVAQSVWGKITRIELTTPETMTYTYATNALTYGTATPLPLYKEGYTAKFENQTYTLLKGNTGVIATGMFPPSTGTAPIKLRITGSTGATGEAEVQLMDGEVYKGFEAGKTHTVTLSLGANEKEITVSATTIEEWGTGGTSNATSDGEYYSVGDYFQKDNNILGIVCQLDQTIDYNEPTKKGKKGLILYPAEPPLTTDATGTQATMSYSEAIAWCTALNATGNTGWRLPTAEELANILSVYNAATEKWNALFSAANGTAIDTADNAYWSAGDADVTGATRKVRCVRRFDAAR